MHAGILSYMHVCVCHSIFPHLFHVSLKPQAETVDESLKMFLKTKSQVFQYPFTLFAYTDV